MLLSFVILRRCVCCNFQSLKFFINCSTSINIQMHAAQAEDGVHIGGLAVADSDGTGIGHIQRVVHLNHGIQLGVAVGRVDVF